MQNFSNLSYSQFLEDLRQVLPTNPDWNTSIPTETGNVFLSMMASVATSVEYYTSRRLQEAFLETSQSPIGTLTAARMLSNSLRSKNPSVASVSFRRANNSSTANYIIPAYSTWKINSSDFYNGSEILFSGSQTTGIFDLIEGTKVVKTFISDGTPYQKLYVSSDFKSGKRVQVNAVDPVTNSASDWTRVESLIESGISINQDNSGTFYTTATNTFESSVYQDGTVQIKFGDGKFGNIPVSGSTITITYFEVSGGTLNGTPSTSLVSIDSVPVSFDKESFNIDIPNLVCNNISSGSKEPEYYFYKSFSPNYHAAQERAVNFQDIEVSLLNFTYNGTDFRPISAVKCISERNSKEANPLMANIISPIILVDQNLFEDDNFKREISEYISENMSFCAVVPRLAEIVPLKISIDVIGDVGNFSRAEVESTIKNSLYKLIKIQSYNSSSGTLEWDVSSANNDLLGKSYTKSEFYKTISLDLPSVNYNIRDFENNPLSIELESYQVLGLDMITSDLVEINFQ